MAPQGPWDQTQATRIGRPPQTTSPLRGLPCSLSAPSARSPRKPLVLSVLQQCPSPLSGHCRVSGAFPTQPLSPTKPCANPLASAGESWDRSPCPGQEASLLKSCPQPCAAQQAHLGFLLKHTLPLPGPLLGNLGWGPREQVSQISPHGPGPLRWRAAAAWQGRGEGSSIPKLGPCWVTAGFPECAAPLEVRG